MSWPLTVLPIETSFAIRGLSRASCSNSCLRPPAPPYLRQTSKPSAAISVARWAAVVPPTSFGLISTPS
jgi:hypothetical protein